VDDGVAQTERDVRQLIGKYIETSPYKLNPDTEKVDKIIKSLAKRKLKHGHQYCPCRMISGNEEMDAKIICPCEYHIEEIRQDDICNCDLFVSSNYKPVPAI
jgi:ferredoxin-thioredoxin reductase catalytic subunit